MEEQHKQREATNEENIQIKLNNQVSSERSLSTSNEVNEIVFMCLTILFSTSLVFQVAARLPFSYKLYDLMPTIVFTCFGAFTMFLYVLKKKPTLKMYLFLISFLIGAILGI